MRMVHSFIFVGMICSAVGACKSRNKSDLADETADNAFIQGHRKRLEAEIPEIKADLEKQNQNSSYHRQTSTDAVTELEIRLRIKEDALYHLSQAGERLVSGGEVQAPQSLSDVEVLAGTTPRPRQKQTVMQSSMVASFLAPIAEATRIKTKHMTPEVVRVLLDGGLSSAIDKSELVARRFATTSTSSQFRELQKLLPLLNSEDVESIYVDPGRVTKVGTALAERSFRSIFTKDLDSLQRLQVKTLITSLQTEMLSSEDLALTPAQRREKLNLAKARLLDAYHNHEALQEMDIQTFTAGLRDFAGFNEFVEAARKGVTAKSSEVRKVPGQGDTNACVAFAVLDDMETFPEVPELSNGFAYSIFLAAQGNEDELPNGLAAAFRKQVGNERDFLKTVDVGTDFFIARVMLRDNGIPPEANFPFNEKSFIPENLNAIADRNFVITDWTSYEGGVSVAHIKKLLDLNIKPIAFIRTNARKIEEDWIRPEPITDFGHALVIDGYGKGIDPFDLKEKEYFWVRDSFTDRPIRHKVSAVELAPIIKSLGKILGVKRLDKPVVYEDK